MIRLSRVPQGKPPALLAVDRDAASAKPPALLTVDRRVGCRSAPSRRPCSPLIDGWGAAGAKPPIGRTRLLFPGDAQIENWQYALKLSPRSKAIRKTLATVDLYKVGHHGSRNATPKTLWGGFKNRRKGLRTLMSTKAGKFPGHPGSGTEVPRETLKQALTSETRLTNTQDLPGTRKEFFVDVDVPLR